MIVEGGGGFATTVTSSSVSLEATTINVDSTADFKDVDFIWIGDEKINYAGKTATSFTGCVRGQDGTSCSIHSSGVKVYNDDSNITNNILGYNVGVANSTLGAARTLAQVTLRVLRVLPRVIAWDYPFLEGNLVIIKYIILYPLSAGLVFTLALYFRNLIL